jgi:hypothetical protein
MLKTSAIAVTAAIAISAFAAPSAEAMSLGSLSRQHTVVNTDEIVTGSIPAGRSMSQSFQPKLQLIFLSIGNFIREQQSAFTQNGAATVQLITFAAR